MLNVHTLGLRPDFHYGHIFIRKYENRNMPWTDLNIHFQVSPGVSWGSFTIGAIKKKFTPTKKSFLKNNLTPYSWHSLHTHPHISIPTSCSCHMSTAGYENGRGCFVISWKVPFLSFQACDFVVQNPGKFLTDLSQTNVIYLPLWCRHDKVI